MLRIVDEITVLWDVTHLVWRLVVFHRSVVLHFAASIPVVDVLPSQPLLQIPDDTASHATEP
jgi:hypothetical protein